MSRNWRLYLDDMIECCFDIQNFTAGIWFELFDETRVIRNATLRSLEVLGEAAKHIPPEVREQISDVEWSRIIGMRNVLAHDYSGVSMKIVWDVVQNKIPELERNLKEYRDSLPHES
jgi:uncharacterized protein with HEPN domain